MSRDGGSARESGDVRAVARRRLLGLSGPRSAASGRSRPAGSDAGPDDPDPGVAARELASDRTVQPPRLAERLPVTLHRGRLGLDPRAALALAVVALLAGLYGAGYWWRAHPEEVPVPQRATLVSSPTPAATVVVDVQGRVRRPGIVRLPAGARAVDAVRAAGGVPAGTSTAGLNLARVLSDGEQLVVGASPASGPPGAAGAASGAAAGGGQPPGPLDLNSATLEQLDELPGVGPVLAQRILDFRSEHGRFTAVEELQEVPGIGPAKFASLKSKVRV